MLTHYGLSIAALLASTYLQWISGEPASYLLWLVIFTAVIGTVLFPVIAFLLQAAPWPIGLKWLGVFVYLLLILNMIPYFSSDGRLLTVEIFTMGNQSPKPSFPFNGGLHIITLLSFLLSLVIFRKKPIVA